MKKLLLSAAMLLAAGTLYVASAQEPQTQKPTPEQKAESQARRLASTLLLSDEATAKFVPVYKSYKMEMNAVNEKYRPAKRPEEMKGQPLTDKEVDAIIRNGFAKSKEILNIREAYYEKFLKVLTPKQAKKMYEEEKNSADMAAHRRWEKCHAQGAGRQPAGPRPNAGMAR